MNPSRYDEVNAELRTVRLYLLSVEAIIVEIDTLIYTMENVKAVQYDKVPVHTPESVKEEHRLELIEEKAELEKQLDMTMLAYAPVKAKLLNVLDGLDPFVSEILLEKYGLILNDDEFYVSGETKTYAQLAHRHGGYTTQGLWALVKREVDK